MGDNLIVAIQITLAGMGLVFAAIILLWMVMIVLVRFTSSEGIPTRADEPGDDRKRQAAAAAVAVALASQTDREPHEFPLPPTAIVSAWQAVMRSNMLNKRGRNR